MQETIKLKNVATAQWDFAELRRNDNFVYVDKTDMLARLAQKDPDAIYFISRPRRFGKSLMLTTLKCMFEGRRELFRGLKIEKTGWDWEKTYPVLLLNMQEFKCPTADALEAKLYGFVRTLARQYKVRIDWKENSLSGPAFTECLKAIGRKGRFVVLVDEYDVPLQGFLGKPELETVRTILHDFYSAFKSNVGSIRFLMMTGVSKFTKLSVFSSLNNLTDLTIESGEHAALLGYTREELKEYFSGHIAELGRRLNESPDEVFRDILGWYDSYRFSPYSETKVVNPVALGQAFNFGHFGSFWSATGMPSLILERMQASAKRPDQLDGIVATIGDLDVCDALELPWMPLLYQAGYLTIKDVEWKVTRDSGAVPQPFMTLGLPNSEVRMTLSSQWWKTLMHIDESDFKALVRVAERQIAEGDIDALLNETLYQLYAKLPPSWTPKSEQDAKRYFLLFMEMAGAKMQPEVSSARGFADAVVETEKGVWVMEFKFNRSAASAIRQIRDRGYAEAFRKCGVRSSECGVPAANPTIQQSNNPTIILVGIKFDPKIRNIAVPKFEPL